MRIYGFDVGGSSIKHAMVEVEGGRATLVDRRPTIHLEGRGFPELRTKLLSAVAEESRESGIPVAVAISTTGAVDRSGRVLNAGHFDGYVDVDWADLLRAELPGLTASVSAVNDGKASTWAEYATSGAPSEVFANLVVGTGVGGGIVCFGQLLYGDDETAGALGHMKVGVSNGVTCSCGKQGCIETFASAPAITRYYSEVSADAQVSEPCRTFDDVFERASLGDPVSIRAFEIAGEWLGVAISNVINVLNPRRITVGGGVLEASNNLDESGDGGPYLRAAVRRANELAFEDIASGTLILPAVAGNDAGLLGAALLHAHHRDD